MHPAYQIRKLPGGNRLWEVIFKFKTGHLETWIGFSSEIEARNWVDRKLLDIAAPQK